MLNFKFINLLRFFGFFALLLIPLTVSSETELAECICNNAVNCRESDLEKGFWIRSVLPDGSAIYRGFFRGVCVDFFVDDKLNVTVKSENRCFANMFDKILKYMSGHVGYPSVEIMDIYGISLSERIYITKNLARVIGIVS